MTREEITEEQLALCKSYEDYERTGMFTKEQLEMIKRGYRYGLDVKTFANPKYSDYQMQAIAIGCQRGLDIRYLTKYRLNAQQAFAILFGLQHGLNIKLFANPKYSGIQMWRIADGLYAKIDVSEYCDVTNSIPPSKKIVYQNSSPEFTAWEF